jgi:hypothetical protein
MKIDTVGKSTFRRRFVLVLDAHRLYNFNFRTGKKAMQRLLGVVHMNPEVDPSQWDHAEEDRYGLGGVRTPEKFYELFGIDVINKTTQKNLCMFVEEGKMHNMFTRALRKDGMGIDYSGVDFRWRDPNNRPN